MKLIILDRDGVINLDSPHFIKTPDEWIPIPGSLEAIARLCQHHYRVAIATNQSGLARGLFTLEQLSAIHHKMLEALSALGGEIEAIAFCPHHPDDHCDCRKPKPGLIIDLLNRTQLKANEALVVGDSLRDLQAGIAAGCATSLVRTGNGEKTITQGDSLLQHVTVYDDLAAVVDAILAQAHT